MRVLLADHVDPVCAQVLRDRGFEVRELAQAGPEAWRELLVEADALIVRSAVQVTAELMRAAPRLKVIGRAGVGVDNIDLEAATRQGILVLNAPDANTISAAEHTCALILALARHIPQADASMKAGRWDRRAFLGVELYGKTLGIIGLGKIGREVASRMRAFGMRLLGYDPMLAPEVAASIGVELADLETVLAQADFLTLHTPLTEQTRNLLNRARLAQTKPGVRIINCARGGIVREEDLLEALESGHVAGAALDVFSQEPPGEALGALIRHPRVITTPHIGASTEEAQHKVARQIAEAVADALLGRAVRNAVNGMAIQLAMNEEVQPYLRLAEQMGRLLAGFLRGQLRRVHVRYVGERIRRFPEVLTVALLKGLLSEWLSEPVNYINAPVLAEQMGLGVRQELDSAVDNYTNLLELLYESTQERRLLAGTVFGKDVRIVRVDEYPLELRPEGHLLFYHNLDRPGMLARVGAMLAEAGINIAALSLGRLAPGSAALTVIVTDQPISEAVQERLRGLEGVWDVRVVTMA
ncbi:MAG: phosphoglycerate dehydrogenase [Bacteroidetes bacterium]|nr:phosphoglycerate dehydrogenase [Rhodothermia bacterium]MCX7906292.1 phosphoglycerate dehydrogenase [Bacteroidota bacterium]MDW8285678.1 phosphoglycerate dehydrogenase [Bacteroidota bacterium]